MKGYRRLLRWAALPVTDRRWAAPLSAVALGFGLFVGVAIGPGAAGTFAGGAAQIIEVPGFGGAGVDTASKEAKPSPALARGGDGRQEDGDSFSSASSAFPSTLSPPAGGSENAGSGEAPQPEDEPSAPVQAPEQEKETLGGVAVHVNTAAGSYALAEPDGTLDVIHAATAPRTGTKVEVPIRSLANGTLAEAGTRIRLGRRTHAELSGVVTYVDPTPSDPAYTVSKRGISVLVHVDPDPTGLAPALPALGAFATVTVEIEKPEAVPPAPAEPAIPGEPDPAAAAASPAPLPVPSSCAADPAQPPPPSIQPGAVLWQRSVEAGGAPTTYGDFEGIVKAVCSDAGELLVSADDIGESGADLTFDVPADIDLTRLRVGDSIVATATIAADGTLLLTGLADDERTKGADDAEAAQGDLLSGMRATESHASQAVHKPFTTA